MSRESQNLAKLDDVCSKVKAKEGTIRTNGVALDYWVQKEVDRCADIDREKVKAILNKYLN